MDRLNEILQTYKYPALLGLVGSVLIISGSFNSFGFSTKPPEIPKESIVSNTDTGELLKVDIGGAVEKPGLYTLPKNSRIDDLLKSAGGLLADVNTEFVAKQLNLSQKLIDGQKVYIPFQSESSTTAVLGTTNVNDSKDRKINLNTSTQSEIETLPGVGPSTAQKIISSRPFTNVNELLQKKIVGKALFEKIKDDIEI